MSDTILVEYKGHLAYLTLNRPEVFNALNLPTLQALRKVIEELRFKDDIRAVIITGAGEKSFCSGADLKERATLPPEKVREYIYTIRTTFTAVEDLPMPVICAINGLALGGGTELALACDLRIAAQHATMGLTEVSLGIIPGAGGTQRIARLIGKGKAKELLFTARKVSASEALSIGLVNQVVPGEELLREATQLGEAIAANAPIAVRQAKLALNKGLEIEQSVGLALETAAYDICIPTQDRLEGLAAFKEKRKPVYQGK